MSGMSGNSTLGAAKAARYNEYYTQLSDIEKELRHYRKHFKDKVVLCNCDDPFESNFFKYFVLNFNRLKLRKLIATCYAGSPIAGKQLSLFDVAEDAAPNTPYKAVVTVVRDATGDGGIDMFDVAELFRTGENELTKLDGDGDFRSDECLALMDEADIVVTNPPFSLFREFICTLVRHKKSFVVIGPDSGTKYKETFPLIKKNELWVGMTKPKRFFVTDTYDKADVKVDDDGRRYVQMGNVSWFTNLDLKKRHEKKILFREYDPENYQSYTNYGGIDVPKASDIPCDYAGYMGVPINFLEEFNPDQFEIIGLGEGNLAKEIGVTRNQRGRTDLEVQDPDGSFRRPFARIVIRNLHPEAPED